MKAVVQRVSEATLSVGGELVSKIQKGFVVYFGQQITLAYHCTLLEVYLDNLTRCLKRQINLFVGEQVADHSDIFGKVFRRNDYTIYVENIITRCGSLWGICAALMIFVIVISAQTYAEDGKNDCGDNPLPFHIVKLLDCKQKYSRKIIKNNSKSVL